ncbi:MULTISPECIES: phospholipase effector Tle1 domain-containing protein [unclassified Stenotrophomonas]|jgi:hypothetical protein|uniref:phospholipase effector Tle1 domain-containing protein n=1 Tax=unclassified Stenotrophomonas TaxID=196198 RepID=UPI000302BBCE|nr:MULTISPECIES: DUF2235 domain-containing protein [unclassified Stenotrophomonas]QIO87141.1 type IV secretion protein Rhs [Stenotrophomonas rhizophila]
MAGGHGNEGTAAAVPLQIGLFFDGTRNNADNLRHASRPPGSTTPAPRPPAIRADDASPYQSRLTSSYSNGLTNIARLHGLYPDHRGTGHPAAGPLSLAIYIEGVGTRTGKDDDLMGLAFGVGRTGVRAKVHRALDVLLPDALRTLARQPRLPAIAAVRVDLFGYSRGAAAARDAVNRLARPEGAAWLREQLVRAGLALAPAFPGQARRVRFVGLLDTVVAVDRRQRDQLPEVALAADCADTVLQLTARDEHREHFALTSVAPPHEEIALPGVHANIGGGYDQTVEGPKLLTRPLGQILDDHGLADGATPPLSLLRASDVHRRAQAQCRQWQATLSLGDEAVWVDVWHQWQQQRRAGSRSVRLLPTLHVYAAVVLRRSIDPRYQWIALRLLHQRAAAAGVPWRATPDQDPALALPAPLLPIAARLLAGQPLDAAQERLLRQRYVMQSAHWNFDALGDTALLYAADEAARELPYRPGPGLFYVNRPTEDGQRVVLANA